MQWGVHLPHLGRQATPENLTRFSQRIEALGYHSGWVSDHIAWPAEHAPEYPYTDDGKFPAGADMPWLEPIASLLFVAGCTERIGLGTTVLIVGYRPAVFTAKLLATLDVLSRGRLILGVGVGWMREEFEALGMPFDHRGARADETLAIWDALFRDEWPTFEGRFTRFGEIGFWPKPVQSPLPIWVGGDTEPAFRRTARVGACFHAAFQSLDEVAASWRRVRQLAAEEGRDPDALTCSLRWYLDPDALMPAHKSVHGSPQQMIEQAHALAAIGVSHVVLDPVAKGGFEGRLASLERFAADVMPHC